MSSEAAQPSEVTSASPPHTTSVLTEYGILVGVLFTLHLVLFLGRIPLASHDLSSYLEPAILWEKSGLLAGPASQHQDILYRIGYYACPPGYFVCLGSWMKLFGSDSSAVYSFHHFVHLVYSILIWSVLRGVFRFPIRSAVIGTAIAFPLFSIGRPDQSGLLFGAAALRIISPTIGFRFFAASLLLSCSVFCSPGYGASSSGTVALFLYLQGHGTWVRRSFICLVFTMFCILSFLTLAAILLHQQSFDYQTALAQWMNHLAIRGAELNRSPDWIEPYTLRFVVLPLGLLTLVPLAIFVAKKASLNRNAVVAILCALGGMLLWLTTSRSAFLMSGHYGCIGIVLLHAAFQTVNVPTLRRVGFVVSIGYLLSALDVHKRSYLIPLLDNSRVAESNFAIPIPEDSIIALDSPAFLRHYRTSRTISYEIYASLNRWRDYLARTPSAVLARHPELQPFPPPEPEWIIITRSTYFNFSPRPSQDYELVHGDISSDTSPWRSFPGVVDKPFSLLFFRRNSGSAKK